MTFIPCHSIASARGTSLLRCGLLIALVATAQAGVAATRNWPGAAPCDSTLQACVDASTHGDVVAIVTDDPIVETIDVDVAITIRPGNESRPRFANTRGINATVPGSGFTLAIEGIEFLNGGIFINRTGDGFTRIRNNRLTNSQTTAASRISLRGLAIDGSALRYEITGNEVEVTPASVNKRGIYVSTQAGGMTGEGIIAWNRVRSHGDSLGAGIGVFSRAERDHEFSLMGNEIRGNFERGGLYVAPEISSGSGGEVEATIANNLVACTSFIAGEAFPRGISVVQTNALTQAFVVNNTVVRCHDGISFIDGSTVPGGDIGGTVANNLVAYNNTGIFLNPGYFDGTTINRNLLFANGSNQLPADPNQVNADPELVAIDHPRLRAGSPAIDAGDAVTAQLVLGLASLPQVDLDGLRRTIGTGSTAVDIGAYEFGDLSLLARKSDGLTNNHFLIDHPSLNGQTGIRLQLTKNFTPPGFPATENLGTFGVWYTSNRWSPFMQEGLMPQGAAFNVFVPGRQGAFGSAYAHTVTAGNTTAHLTRLSQTYLNGTKNAIALVTPNWNHPGSSIYTPHNFAVGPACLGDPGPECWTILNMDFADMPLNATFNVYAQDASPNAFVHAANAGNSTGASTVMDHRLLNSTPCAQPHVTRKLGAVNDTSFDVYYGTDRWSIYHQSGGAIAGSEFYVIVDPRQVFECTDIIFADDFES